MINKENGLHKKRTPNETVTVKLWHSSSKALDAEEVWCTYINTALPFTHQYTSFISDKNKHREKISLCTKKSHLSLYKWPNYAKINKLFKMLFSLSVKRYQHVTRYQISACNYIVYQLTSNITSLYPTLQQLTSNIFSSLYPTVRHSECLDK